MGAGIKERATCEMGLMLKKIKFRKTTAINQNNFLK